MSMLIDWTLVGSPCPECGTRDVVQVRQVFVVQPMGTYSLAGAQPKVAAKLGWEFRCTGCAASGPATPKDHVPTVE